MPDISVPAPTPSLPRDIFNVFVMTGLEPCVSFTRLASIYFSGSFCTVARQHRRRMRTQYPFSRPTPRFFPMGRVLPWISSTTTTYVPSTQKLILPCIVRVGSTLASYRTRCTSTLVSYPMCFYPSIVLYVLLL